MSYISYHITVTNLLNTSMHKSINISQKVFSSRWKDTEARRQRSKATSGVAGGWERSRCPRLRFPESLFDMRTLFSCWPLFTDPRIAQSSAQCLVSSNSGRVSAVAAAAAMWGTDTTCDHRLDKTSSSTEIEVNVCLSSAFSSATKRCHLNIYLSSSVSVLIFMTWQVSRYLTLCVYPTLRVHTRWPDAGDQIIYSTKKVTTRQQMARVATITSILPASCPIHRAALATFSK